MDLTLRSVVIDCHDPRALAPFWRGALGLDEEYADDAWVAVRSPDGRVRISFQRVPEDKVTKNRVHLDLATADVPAQVERLKGLGAIWLYDSADPEDVFTTMADPEGNELCVVLAD